MVNTISKAFCFVFLASALFISGVLGGEITCEALDRSTCAFAVSSSGLRCVLEKHVRAGGLKKEYSCRKSCVEATGVAGLIESDGCVAACGLDRDTVGISSDPFLDGRFMRRLCSSDCYDSCPNIVDLYASVAAGEGVSLSSLCEVKNSRREMEEIKSGRAQVVGRKLGGWGAQSPRAGGRKLIASGNDDAPAPEAGRMLMAEEADAPAPEAGRMLMAEEADAPAPEAGRLLMAEEADAPAPA